MKYPELIVDMQVSAKDVRSFVVTEIDPKDLPNDYSSVRLRGHDEHTPEIPGVTYWAIEKLLNRAFSYLFLNYEGKQYYSPKKDRLTYFYYSDSNTAKLYTPKNPRGVYVC